MRTENTAFKMGDRFVNLRYALIAEYKNNDSNIFQSIIDAEFMQEYFSYESHHFNGGSVYTDFKLFNDFDEPDNDQQQVFRVEEIAEFINDIFQEVKI